MFLKVSLMKRVMRFGKKDKLVPRFTSSFLITKYIREAAYQLELSKSVHEIHPVFDILMLWKHVLDVSYVIREESL